MSPPVFTASCVPRALQARRPPRPTLSRVDLLARLLQMWPHEIADPTPAGAARLIAALEKALRNERQRGKAGHWTYDLNRHKMLVDALRDERERVAVLWPQPTWPARLPSGRSATLAGSALS